MTIFYQSFSLTDVRGAIEVFMDDEKFEKAKATEWLWALSIVKIMKALMHFPKYAQYNFCDDGKELSELFPGLRIELPDRESIQQKWINSFPHCLRLTSQTHKDATDIFRALFTRWVIIPQKNSDNMEE